MIKAGIFAAALIAVSLTSVSLAADPLPAPPLGPTPGAVPIPVQPAPTPEACDAPTLTWLVGKPRTEIPTPIDPSRRRVYCSSCVITEDYRPDRTDIVFDDRTGLVTEVKCG